MADANEFRRGRENQRAGAIGDAADAVGGGPSQRVKPPKFGGTAGQGTQYRRPNGTTYWSKFGPKSRQDKPVAPAPAEPADTEKSKKYDSKKGAY